MFVPLYTEVIFTINDRKFKSLTIVCCHHQIDFGRGRVGSNDEPGDGSAMMPSLGLDSRWMLRGCCITPVSLLGFADSTTS